MSEHLHKGATLVHFHYIGQYPPAGPVLCADLLGLKPCQLLHWHPGAKASLVKKISTRRDMRETGSQMSCN